MKKILIATAAISAFAFPAIAGSVGPVDTGNNTVVVPASEPMGSSSSWIIPLVAIGLIALVISQDSDDEPPV